MKKTGAGLKVVKVDRENHDTTSIYFAGPDAERFKNRKAGQFASIRVLRNGAWTEPHPFTISSAPEDDTLRMTIKKSGEFTTSVIPEIEPGTPIQFSGPFGRFCEGIDDNKEIVMIAGGVGITPFLSVLRHFADIGADNSVVLFWGNKTEADAFAAKELESFTKRLRLHVVHALSRVDASEQKPSPLFDDGRPGRVSVEYGRLNRDIFSRHILFTNAAFYLCGPPAMQQSVLAELAKVGVEPGAVRTEAFVFSPSPPNPGSKG